MIKVAVIAGTPVDTQMGVDYLEKKNAEYELPVVYPVYMPVSSSCDEQLKFQYSDDAAKHKRMDEIFDKAMQEAAAEKERAARETGAAEKTDPSGEK